MRKRIGFIGGAAAPSPVGAVAPELQPLLPQGAEILVFPSRVPAFPYTPLERVLQDLGHTDAAFTAAENGCEVIVIDSVGDYGIEAMRSSLPIPVFGAGESGMAAAAMGGRRFAIVTVWPPSMNFIVEGRVRAAGFNDACVGILNVGSEEDVQRPGGTAAYLSRVRYGQQAIVDRISAAIGGAAASGAEAVLLGCTCMSPIAETLSATASVPVINPLAAALTVALEARPVPPRVLRSGHREAFRKMVEAVADEPPEPCPACVVAEEL
jgi:allantoin racemase